MLFYKNHELKAGERVFIFGDVHGAFHLVEKAIHDLGITDKDVRVFLGDLTDRGNQNFKAVEYATKGENSFVVRGNHDDMMIRGLLEGDDEQYIGWLKNGGKTVVEELGEEGCTCLAVMLEDKAYSLLTLSRGDKAYGFCHGEWPNNFRSIPPQVLEEVLKDKYAGSVDYAYRAATDMMIWGRELLADIGYGFEISSVLGVDYMFHGHSYVETPLIHGNRVYMDTGGVFNNNLTVAVIEPDGELWYYSTLEGEDL